MDDTDLEDTHHSEIQKPKVKIGILLREQREMRNISIEDITQALKMRPRLIRAIEESDYKTLPDATTLGGLVKIYANYIGLDGEYFAGRYRTEVEGMNKPVEIDFPDMLPVGFKLPKMALFASLFLLFIFYFIDIPSLFNPDFMDNITQTEGVDNAILKEKPKPLPMVKNSPDFSPKNVSESAPKKSGKKEVVLIATPASLPQIIQSKNILLKAERGESWIEIRNPAQKIIYSGIIPRGKTYNIPDQENLTLKTGNAFALDVYLGTEKLNVFSKDSHVVRNFSLNYKDLLKYKQGNVDE